MLSALMPTSQGLWDNSRFRRFSSSRVRWIDVLILGGAGTLAAVLTATMDFDLRIPGHAILRTVLPLALGVAFVPRRGSGFVMSGSGGLATLALRTAGWNAGGVGALTSLLLTGPLLDVASRWSARGWHIYLWFAAAGFTSNLAAFSLRAIAKAGGGQVGRPFAEWWPSAIISYSVCGLLAGLLSAAICFRSSANKMRDTEHRSREPRTS